jgi:hypothetical protein
MYEKFSTFPRVEACVNRMKTSASTRDWRIWTDKGARAALMFISFTNASVGPGQLAVPSPA